jgi:hypothetical protein
VVRFAILRLLLIVNRLTSSGVKYQGRQVVVIQHDDDTAYNPKKDIEFDADGGDSVESFRKGHP